MELLGPFVHVVGLRVGDGSVSGFFPLVLVAFFTVFLLDFRIVTVRCLACCTAVYRALFFSSPVSEHCPFSLRDSARALRACSQSV